MSPSLTLDRLCASTPDGRVLFEDLSLSFGTERTGLVGANGVGKTTLLHIVAGLRRPTRGEVVVAGRTALLTQEVSPDPIQTVADAFGVRAALEVLDRAQSGLADAEDLAAADWTLEDRLASSLSAVDVTVAPSTPLSRLSGGQRTRVRLAALMFQSPDWLLLDEPTNHLDREGRTVVRDVLANWKGGAIVVSHDRELLEAMDAIVELTPRGGRRFGGGYSIYRAESEAMRDKAEHRLAEAERADRRIGREIQAQSERQVRRDRVGARKAAGGGQPRILLGRMKAQAEVTSGEASRLADRRRDRSRQDVEAARAEVAIHVPLTTHVPPTGLAPGRRVLSLEGVEAGHGDGPPVLLDVSLDMRGPERLAITGPNGSGKTTLLDVLSGTLAPRRGRVEIGVPFAHLDQTVALLDSSGSIRDAFLRLHPSVDENACRAALARFRFRADAGLQAVDTLSGGQRLRAGLACVLGGPQPPQLLILDEPTNHLDLESLDSVEAGLRAYDGALIVVSHDERFLQAIEIDRRLDLGGAPGSLAPTDAPL